MGENKFTVELDGPVARITLTNPEKHNAFDDGLIAGLTAAFKSVGQEADVRVVVLASEGKSFSAGADLGWMQRMADYSEEDNIKDAMGLARLMETINRCPKPVVGLVQGAAFGGGVGLAAVCDIVIAGDKASFCLSEVKLGLIPAAISPYVIQAIGIRAARRYFVTAERFSATEAEKLGLVHRVVPQDGLEAAGEEMIALLLANGPQSMVEAKALARAANRPVDEALIEETARWIARIRASDEGREGLAAFFEKRKPSWVVGE